jgi:hypothetical protein
VLYAVSDTRSRTTVRHATLHLDRQTRATVTYRCGVVVAFLSFVGMCVFVFVHLLAVPRSMRLADDPHFG